ncbi:MAG TPA: hypothetical protein VK668_22240 [Mucilaginibacter sp.]|nr:hypothetical protein [Mucilaginibacter sp.]
MNNTFNITRFGRLFVKHTAEHYKNYLMSLTVLMGVLVLGGSFLVYLMPGPLDVGVQSVLFVLILLLAGTMFTSTIFADYGDKNKAITSLTLPASHLEKFLVAWVYSYLLFQVIFTGSYYLVLLFLINVKHFPGQTSEMFNVFDNQGGGILIYLVFALLHSIAFFGAIFFKKLHFIKTAFVFFISIAVLIIINKIMLGILLGKEVMATPPFGDARLIENGKVSDIYLDHQDSSIVLWLMAVLVPIFWVAAYFRLKEKQV